MKRFLFIIFVIAMTPIYLIICFLGWFISGYIEIMTDITEPIVDGMSYFVENMVSFWKRIFERKGEGE